MLLVDIISTRASSMGLQRQAAREPPSGRRRNSALQRRTDERMQLDRSCLRLMLGSNAWMPSRCSVGARLSSTGCSRMTFHRVYPILPAFPFPRASLWPASTVAERTLLASSRRIDERLEQFQRHLLRQPALMKLQFRTNHDHRAAGIIDALAQQVLPETALLALEHIG